MLLETLDNLIKVIKQNTSSLLNLKANLNSPSLTGIPTAPTASKNTSTSQIATTAFVVTEIDDVLKTTQAMMFKGTVSKEEDIPSNHTIGWTYIIAVAGTYLGVECEIGDMIICKESGTVSNNSDWSIVQVNLIGAVTGPKESINSSVAVFDGTTGRVIKDSSVPISNIPRLDTEDNLYTNELAAGRNITNGILEIRGSCTSGRGGALQLFGETYARDPGRFSLRANNGELTSYLEGYPDGRLLWASHQLPLTINGSYPDSKGNITIDTTGITYGVFSDTKDGLVPKYSSDQSGYMLSTDGWVKGGTGSGTVKSVNNIQPDESGNINISLDTELISTDILTDWLNGENPTI